MDRAVDVRYDVHMKNLLLILVGMAVLITGIMLYAGRKAPVMPLEAASTSDFQNANSRIMQQLLQESRGYTQPVREAHALHATIESLGFDPDRTILYWLSPDNQEELKSGDPSMIIDRSRMRDRLLNTVRGSTASDVEYHQILRIYSPALQDALRQIYPR